MAQISPDAEQLARTDIQKFNSSVSESECKNDDSTADDDDDAPAKKPPRSIDDMNFKFDLQLSLDPMLQAALIENRKEVTDSSAFGCELQRAEPNHGLILGTKRNNDWERSELSFLSSFYMLPPIPVLNGLYINSKNTDSFWNRFEIPGLIGIVSIASLTVGFTLGVAIRRYR